LPTLLPDSDSAARHCPKKHLSDDGQRIMATAFHLRQQRGEKELSVLWVEYFGRPTRGENIDYLRNELSRTLNVRSGDLLGIVGVEDARHRVSSELGKGIEFRRSPRGSTAHSRIVGMDCDAQYEIAAILAEQANLETYPAS
jgi:hypothetical protein